MVDMPVSRRGGQPGLVQLTICELRRADGLEIFCGSRSIARSQLGRKPNGLRQPHDHVPAPRPHTLTRFRAAVWRLRTDAHDRGLNRDLRFQEIRDDVETPRPRTHMRIRRRLIAPFCPSFPIFMAMPNPR